MSRRAVALTCALIALLAGGVHLRSASFGFIGVDDPFYVTANPHVTSGLTLNGIAWAFSTGHTGNWHPLTWLSHMADAGRYGASAAGHHATSIALHAANAALLFLFLHRATGAARRSAFAALLFAVHPLNVESVAWIAERKNVLSTLFWLLTMLAYLDWARRRGARRYALVVLLLALGLMAKPMLVTVPIVLLLLDFWPLGRGRTGVRALTLEKLPLAALAAASGVITFVVQRREGLTADLAQYPPGVRLANAAVSSLAYLRKMALPSDLCILYQHPGDTLPLWKIVVSGTLIAAATGAALRVRRERPSLAFGWLWYLVTLVPVIGLVQVGQQAMADRYAYVTLIGIFVLVAWGVPGALPRRGRALACAGACALIPALATATVVQEGHWRSDGAIARRAIAMNPGSLSVATAMTATLARAGKADEAVVILGELPDPVQAMFVVGQLVARAGMLDFALRVYEAAIVREPGLAKLRNHYGAALAKSGDLVRAREQFSAALRLDPGYAEARENLRKARRP